MWQIELKVESMNLGGLEVSRARAFRARARSLRGLAGDSLAISVGKYGQFAVTIVTLPLISRALDTEEFAQYAILLGAYFYGSILGDWGLPIAYAAELRGLEGDGERVALRDSFFTLRLITSTAILALSVTAILLTGTYSVTVGLSAGLISSASEDWVLISQSRFVASVVAQWVGRLVYLAGLCTVLVFAPYASLIGLSLLLGGVVSTVTTWRLCGRPKIRLSTRIAHRVGIGTPAVLARLTINAYGAGMTTAVAGYFSAAAISVFAASDRVVRAAQASLDAVVLALLPRLHDARARREGRDGRLSSAGSIGAVAAAALVASCIISYLAPQIIGLLFGSKYAESVGILRLAAFILPAATTTSMTVTNYLLPAQKTTQILACVLCGLCAAALLLFTNVSGLSGAHKLLLAGMTAEWVSAGLLCAAAIAPQKSQPDDRERMSLGGETLCVD